MVSFGDAPCIWYDNARNQAASQPGAANPARGLPAPDVSVGIAAKVANAFRDGMQALLGEKS